jgi:ATP-binding cassette, subfamily B, bacterial PglK
MIDFKEIFKFLFLFSNNNKLILLFLLLIIGVCLEIFGLSAIVPLLILLTNPEGGEAQEIFEISKNFGFVSYDLFLNSFLIIIVFLYSIRAIFLIILTYIKNVFLQKLTYKISSSLFSKYLNSNYQFHISNSSASLHKNISIEVNYINGFFLSFIDFCIEFFLVLAIIITLLFFEPVGAFFVGLYFSIFTSLYFIFSKNKIQKWGVEREHIEDKLSNLVLESFSGFKEIIIYKSKQFFFNEFNSLSFNKAKISSRYSTLSQLPRYFFELISVIGIVGFIFILLLKEYDVSKVISILGLFIAAVFRLLPSLNKIISSIQSLKYFKNSFNLIKNQIELNKDDIEVQKDQNGIIFKNKIQIKKINFKYPSSSSLLFENLNLVIHSGEAIGFIGASGAGKSTLINLILGFQFPVSGNILIDNIELTDGNLQSWLDQIGYVPQDTFLLNGTIAENICFGCDQNNIKVDKIIDSINQSNLTEFIESLPEGYNTEVGERGAQLSGGQKQRIGIARALYKNASVLILDEATSSLDSNSENSILKTINQLKTSKTILIITHRLESLMFCDKVYELKNGKLTNTSIL